MKIAVVSDDKKTVTEHFGGAPHFVIVEVEDGKIINEEIREKPGHKEFAKEETHSQMIPEKGHGLTPKASERHRQMGEIVKDCKAIIAGRMGLGAYVDLRNLGFEVIATAVKDIKEAALLYAKGELSHMSERLH